MNDVKFRVESTIDIDGAREFFERSKLASWAEVAAELFPHEVAKFGVPTVFAEVCRLEKEAIEAGEW